MPRLPEEGKKRRVYFNVLGSSWEFIFNGKYQRKEQTQTDAEYWQLFDFKFLQGRPYTNDEVTKQTLRS